jgi:hypothetical protein
MATNKDPNTRFMQKVDFRAGQCWLWTGAKSHGYGSFYINGRLVRAHRYAYTLFVGSIPEGMDLHHICNVTDCVNPKHLEPLSSKDHMEKTPGIWHNRYKNQCPKGHPYDSLYQGQRKCRECNKQNNRALRARKKMRSTY